MRHYFSTIRSRVLTSILVFAAVLFLMIQYQYQIKLKQLLQESEKVKFETVVDTVVPILSVNLAFDLTGENRRFLDELIRHNPDLKAVRLWDAEGRELFGWTRKGSHAETVGYRKALIDRQTQRKVGEVELLFINRALLMAKQQYGSFLFRFLAVTLFSVALLFLILNRAFKPLDVLVKWIRDFDPKSDDTAQMPVCRSTEIVMIEEAIRQLIARIRHYTSELDSLNRSLDRKVIERTEALSKANRKLEEEIRIRQATEEALKAANARLTELSRIDALTGIANRRYFQEHFRDRWEICIRERLPISLVICDIDFFKRINDAFGHLAGDAVIVTIARTLQRALKRKTDLVARYGGEEFVFVLFDTGEEEALHFVREVQKQIASIGAFPPPAEAVAGVTLSFGLCSHVPQPREGIDCCIAAADEALYRAKEAGRNRLESADYC